MSKQSATKSITEVEIIANPNIPALLSDSVHCAVRSDGIYMLRFLTGLPEGQLEQAKIMMPENNVKELIDLLCEQTKHYPAKPKAQKKSAKATQ